VSVVVSDTILSHFDIIYLMVPFLGQFDELFCVFVFRKSVILVWAALLLDDKKRRDVQASTI